MNLYTQQSNNVRKTWILMLLFFLIIGAIAYFLSYYFDYYEILVVALIFSLTLNISAYWFSDKIILNSTEASKLEFKDNPELFRIVENICITAGLPTPKIYILPEQSLNAFATGRDPKRGAIALTRGLAEKLDRSELEGVIAHEISHIGNRDTLLQSVVVVLVGLVMIVSNFFLRGSFWAGGGKKDNGDSGAQAGGALAIIGVILIALSPIIAKMIQMAISRKRELLADSSSALLTRYPEGLASALEKISRDLIPTKFASNTTAHLYISNPFQNQKKKPIFSKLFLTHPPIEERIKFLREMDNL